MAQRIHEEIERLERMSSLTSENKETTYSDTEILSSIMESASSDNYSISTSADTAGKVGKSI